jgi:hypothetical protein
LEDDLRRECLHSVGGTTIARDHVCDFDIFIVKYDRVHSKFEVIVVDERNILNRFAIKFREFKELEFFVWSSGARRKGTRRYKESLL